MTLSNLLFLASALLVLILCGVIVVSTVRGRWESARRLGRVLGVFVAGYAAILVRGGGQCESRAG